jgi:ribosomal-protein-alanine N-acetyltransferase
LLLHLVAQARAWRAVAIVLDVRRSNLAAQALYAREQFQVIGVRPAYYADDGEDAVVMQLRF